MSWLSSYPLSFTAVIAIIIFISLKFIKSWNGSSNGLHSIPTIGPSGPLVSYIGAFGLLFDSLGTFQKGYRKYRNRLFKIADFRSWMIVVSGPQYIEDIRKAPADVLLFEAAIDEALHALCPDMRRSHFHVPIIREQLTRELTDSFLDIREEVVAAFDDVLIVNNQEEWIKFPALDTTLVVVGRATHRLFVGLPLCRDPAYISYCVKFAVSIGKAASIIRLFPLWLRGYVGRPFADVPTALKKNMDYLRPLVEERRRNMALYGKDYPGKPQDMLSWFMDDVDGNTDEEKLRHIAFHILTVDYGAVYTTAMSFTQALYHLASRPEYIEPLREEMESVVAQEGWTKSAMGNLRKLDSFLKESQRLTGLSAVSTYRRVLKPFTFSDGTCIPPGHTLAIAAHSTHLDDVIYPDANHFNGFRFSDMDGTSENCQMVTPSQDYLPFGVGRHMCPGRFFTVVVMKIMMTHIIMNYDVGLEKEGERPLESWFITDNIPNDTARVLLRKRATTGDASV